MQTDNRTILRDLKLTEMLPHTVLQDDYIVQVAINTYNHYKNSQYQSLGSRPDLYKENLIKLGYKWLNDVEMILYDNTNENDIDKLFDDINSMISKTKVHINDKPIVALDLETTGLNRTWKHWGGQVRLPLHIIGVGVALLTEDEQEVGLYIPLGHADSNNFTWEQVKPFVQKLHDNFQVVYHNGLYDREVLQLHGISLPSTTWSDTMLMAIAVMLRVNAKSSAIGLKHLSDEYLDRQMLEIKELDKDAEIYKLPAESALTYGSADVINTLKLYWLFREGEDFTDPYLDQKLIMGIDTVAADFSNTMNRFNYPIHTTNSQQLCRTLFRRALICERKLADISNNQIENLTSDEQIGQWIYNEILRDFKTEMMDDTTTPAKEKELIDALNNLLKVEYGMEVKHVTLKSGATKIKANCGDSVLSSLLWKPEKLYFMDKDRLEKLLDFCEILGLLRSLDQSITLVTKFVRYAYTDDCPIPRAGAGVKFFGAISTRYSNESGSGEDRVKFKELKSGLSADFVKGNGLAGFNAQGIPSDGQKYKPAKKLTKIPQALQEQFDNVTKETDANMREYLTYNTKM